MTYEKLKLDKAVTYARLLGFEPTERTLRARVSFNWSGRGGDWFQILANKTQIVLYTVNRESTSSVERACEYLQEIERRQNQSLTDIRAEKTGR